MKNLSKSTYKSWKDMRERCNSPSSRPYHNYGGRGIKICPEWDTYQQFVQDMGIRPPGLTLGRIDNDKGYYKENCEWQNWEKQNANKRLYRNNKTGLAGVRLYASGFWVAQGNKDYLGSSRDFFEACCLRKAWEARR